jgi:transposase-like protein
VITVSMLATIRRMHFRDGVPIRDLSRRTGLSRNTIRRWLKEPSSEEPRYPKRAGSSVLDPWSDRPTLTCQKPVGITGYERRPDVEVPAVVGTHTLYNAPVSCGAL